jgi:glyoxalase family protein
MDIKGLVKGLHHITATVNDAQEDYDFYTKALGLRLVKKQSISTMNGSIISTMPIRSGRHLRYSPLPYKGQG